MSKMKAYLKKAVALLLCCVFLCCPVSAADDCSLRVLIKDEDKNPLGLVNVDLCQVTSFDGAAHTLLEDYAHLGVTAEELNAALSAENAELVYQYIYANEIDGQRIETNSSGAADFVGLPQGIYLVFDSGDQPITFHPYLVELPAETPTGLANSVISEPKVVTVDSHTVLVAIEWLDDDNAAGKRPESVEVKLYRQQNAAGKASGRAEVPFRSVVLNEKCQWQHIFHMLPMSGDYTVQGIEVSEYTLVEIEPVAEGYVLIYQYTPAATPPDDDPPKPTPPTPKPPKDNDKELPQTGFRLMPIYAMLGIGSVLVVLGMVDLCVKKEEL